MRMAEHQLKVRCRVERRTRSTISKEPKVRRLSAGGNWIRTLSPPKRRHFQPILFSYSGVPVSAGKQQLVHREGTSGSYSICSSGESVSRGISPSHVERPIRVLVVREGPMVRFRLPPAPLTMLCAASD